MDNLWMNNEGYYDPTAGEALSRMGGKKMERVESGEIWEVEARNGFVFEMLVLKQQKKYTTGLRLFDEAMEENSIEVPSISIKYADVGRPVYAFNDTLVRFVKALPRAEYETIREAIAGALDLRCEQQVGYTEKEMQDAIEKAKKEATATPMIQIEERPLEEKLEVERYKTKAEVFEKLYRDLLAAVTA